MFETQLYGNIIFINKNIKHQCLFNLFLKSLNLRHLKFFYNLTQKDCGSTGCAIE